MGQLVDRTPDECAGETNEKRQMAQLLTGQWPSRRLWSMDPETDPRRSSGRWDCIALKPPSQMPRNVPNDCGSGAVKFQRRQKKLSSQLFGWLCIFWKMVDVLTSKTHARASRTFQDHDKQRSQSLIMTNPNPIKNVPLVDPLWLGSLSQAATPRCIDIAFAKH